ncbi:MAG: AP2 domain-containing protein [Planctomycetota bacterium]
MTVSQPSGVTESGRRGDDVLTLKEAAALAGIGTASWYEWIKAGKVQPGEWGRRPTGQKCRVWNRSVVLEAIERTRGPAEGHITKPEALDRLGVADKKLKEWVTQGRLPEPTFGNAADGKRILLYSADAIDRLKAELEAEAADKERAAAPRPSPDEKGVWLVPVFSTVHDGLFAKIDADDLLRVGGIRWNLGTSSGTRADDLSTVRVRASKIGSLARLILGLDKDDLRVVAHVNGDGFDCRRSNLSLTTKSAVRKAAKMVDKYAYLPGPFCRLDQRGVVRLPIRTTRSGGMEAQIDAADFERIAGKRWHWSQVGSRPNGGSVVEAVPGTPKPTLARTILGVEQSEQLVQHLNHDKLDCRRANLVVRSRAEVSRRRAKSETLNGKAAVSKFKGVTKAKGWRRWMAKISIDGESRVLGLFWSEVDAALAYDKAAREVDGELAYQNLPDPAEAARLKALEPEPERETGDWPPPGMIDRYEACAIFGIGIGALRVWEKEGRVTCGRMVVRPGEARRHVRLFPKAEIERLKEQFDREGQPYEDPDEPGVWRVPLRAHRERREAIIDAIDLPHVRGRFWNFQPRARGGDDANSPTGTVTLSTATNRHVPLHRILLGLETNDQVVHVIDGDGLNLRRSNLAVRTRAEVIRMKPARKARFEGRISSRYKGVGWDDNRKMWNGQFTVGRTHIGLGRFTSEREAALAYDAAAFAAFGDKTFLNLPGEVRDSTRLERGRRVVREAKQRRLRDRLRQRRIEQRLRTAEGPVSPSAVALSAHTVKDDQARLTFEAPPTVWRRWQRMGWLQSLGQADGTGCRADRLDGLLRYCGLSGLAYEDPKDPTVWRVPLVGETACGREALIDADLVPLVLQYRWRFALTGKAGGGVVETTNPADSVRLHQLAMGGTDEANAMPHVGFRTDDPFDCRRSNLVLRTQSNTNARNRKQETWCGRPVSSRFKGVCWSQRDKRWLAQIKKGSRTFRLGRFRDEVAAARAYDAKARELYGSHARPNFVDDDDGIAAAALPEPIQLPATSPEPAARRAA